VSQLIDFYRGTAPDAEGRFLADVWGWDDEELEITHDYIQWMFPLPERSRFHPTAPTLTPDDIAAFRADALLQDRLRTSFDRILTFLGLARAEDGRVAEGPTFRARVPDVWAVPNHNWLRITRILRSMMLLGREADARALYDSLDELYSSRRFPIRADTFRYWADAVGR
jgi:hypothetical protein